MFVGHYGVSFATKKVDPSIPLWVLFIAVAAARRRLGASRPPGHREGANRSRHYSVQSLGLVLHALHSQLGSGALVVSRRVGLLPPRCVNELKDICTRGGRRGLLSLGARLPCPSARPSPL